MRSLFIGLTILSSCTALATLKDFDIIELKKELNTNNSSAATVSKYLREVVKAAANSEGHIYSTEGQTSKFWQKGEVSCYVYNLTNGTVSHGGRGIHSTTPPHMACRDENGDGVKLGAAGPLKSVPDTYVNTPEYFEFSYETFRNGVIDEMFGDGEAESSNKITFKVDKSNDKLVEVY